MKASWLKQRLCRRQNLTTWLYPQVVSFNSTRIRNFQWEGHERPRSNKLLCGFSNIFFRILKRWISVSGGGHERNHSKNNWIPHWGDETAEAKYSFTCSFLFFFIFSQLSSSSSCWTLKCNKTDRKLFSTAGSSLIKENISVLSFSPDWSVQRGYLRTYFSFLALDKDRIKSLANCYDFWPVFLYNILIDIWLDSTLSKLLIPISRMLCFEVSIQARGASRKKLYRFSF